MAAENQEIPDYRKVVRENAMALLYDASNKFSTHSGSVMISFPSYKNWNDFKVLLYMSAWVRRLQHAIDNEIENDNEMRGLEVTVMRAWNRIPKMYEMEIKWCLSMGNPFDNVMDSGDVLDNVDDDAEWENEVVSEIERAVSGTE